MEFELNNTSGHEGKVAIVTGANTGLGFETSLGLLKCGITVVLACRNGQKAYEAKKKLTALVPKACDIEVLSLDLASLKSVRDFATIFLKSYNRLDYLIENAGIMMPPFQKTEDGFESQIGVNFLGHFLLTKRLFDMLKNTPNSKVISLSSVAHKAGRIQFSDIHYEKKYSKWGAYAQSKLACFMFGYELHRRISEQGLSMKSIIAHPGGSDTELGRHLSPFLYAIFLPVIKVFTHSPKLAAMPTLMAALDDRVDGGSFVGPTGFKELKGKPGVVLAERHAYHEEDAEKLWVLAEELIGEKFEL